MSDAIKPESTPPFDELIVREYLEENPDFFCRHPELVMTMRAPHSERGTVSLIERQQQQLRQRVQQLEEEITSLLTNAHRNEQIYLFNTELSFKLLQCQSVAEVRAILRQDLKRQFNFSHVNLVSVTESDGSLMSLWQQRLQQRHYFGRLTQQESQTLFGEEIGSAALTCLNCCEEKIIFAIASPVASHFHPQMDHLLFEQLRRFLEHLLPKF